MDKDTIVKFVEDGVVVETTTWEHAGFLDKPTDQQVIIAMGLIKPCPNQEECNLNPSDYCECLKQKYLGILQRITKALELEYSSSDYDPEDYEKRIIDAIAKLQLTY